jgi:hypothetical protein
MSFWLPSVTLSSNCWSSARRYNIYIYT